MATLNSCIRDFIDNITVTDRQEESIQSSLSNLDWYLMETENTLHVTNTFPNGSYERDTIIRPLNDIDVFAVLDFEEWKDDNGELPNPQRVLSRFKNYLNSTDDYKDKVSQDRPCVTIQLSNKHIDVLPCFKQSDDSYLIPNYDLQSWVFSYPKQLTENLNNIHRERGYKVKQIIRAVKYGNRDNDKLIPSFHIEETAIAVFLLHSFSNYEEGIRLWFNNADYYTNQDRFKSEVCYEKASKYINQIKDKLNEAKDLLNSKKGRRGNKNLERSLWKRLSYY